VLVLLSYVLGPTPMDLRFWPGAPRGSSARWCWWYTWCSRWRCTCCRLACS